MVRVARRAGLARPADGGERRGVRPLPAGVAPTAAPRRFRRAPLAGRVGRGHAGVATGGPLRGAGRARCAEAGPGLRRHPPRRLHPAGRRLGGAAPATPARHPRRRDLGPGVLRTRRGFRPGRPEGRSPSPRRRLRGQRTEGVGERRPLRRLVPAAGADGPQRSQTARDLVLPHGHADSGNRGATDTAGDGGVALLRDLPPRRGDPRVPAHRSRERGLVRGAGDAERRTRDDHARAGRAAGRGRLLVAGPGLLRTRTRRRPRRRRPGGTRRPGGLRDRDRRAARAVLTTRAPPRGG